MENHWINNNFEIQQEMVDTILVLLGAPIAPLPINEEDVRIACQKAADYMVEKGDWQRKNIHPDHKWAWGVYSTGVLAYAVDMIRKCDSDVCDEIGVARVSETPESWEEIIDNLKKMDENC